MKQNIFDGNNRLIGYTIESGNYIRVYNQIGSYLGYYDKGQDRTYDALTRPVARGNMIGMLLGR